MNGRLATPGALLMLAGAAVLYWGLGIFRGETSGSTTKIIRRGAYPKAPADPARDATGSGGGGRLM